jgi:hypothetical protein
MAKRGRKATYPNAGHDRGTEALQARRALLACGGDPVLAESPLGALLASRRLGMTGGWRYDHDVAIQRHEAGRQLGLARHILFGRPGARAAMLAEMIPGNVDDGCRLDEAAEARIRERYDASDEALKACGPLVRAETMAVCVYDVWPEYHHPDHGVMALDVLWSHPLRRHFDALLAGLDCLVDQYGLQAGRRARAA